MSDWRQSQPDDFALTEKRRPGGSGRSGGEQPGWFSARTLGLMVVGAVFGSALTWTWTQQSADPALQQQLLDRARQIDSLTEDLRSADVALAEQRAALDGMDSLAQFLAAACADDLAKSSTTTRGKLCSSINEKYPKLISDK